MMLIYFYGRYKISCLNWYLILIYLFFYHLHKKYNYFYMLTFQIQIEFYLIVLYYTGIKNNNRNCKI